MKTIKKISIISFLTLGSLTVSAQQVPMYTHYMYNTLVINPAYAGSRDALTVTGLYRTQWVGFSGAPVIQTLTAHAPLKNQHLGLGFSVVNDKRNSTSVVVDFAYKMQLTAKSKLALGISGGMNLFQAQLSSLNLDQQTDPTFQNNINNRVIPNFGFGAYYSRERFYAGISAPSLLQNNYSIVTNADGSTLIGKEQRTYYLIAGTVIKISDNLAFKPTTLIKVTAGAPIQADLTASFIIVKKLTLGIMYRSGDAAGALIGFDITNQFHLGYSYDWSYGLKTSVYNQGSHELMLRYDFIYGSKKQIHSPRYF